MDKPTTEKVRPKLYACKECGHEVTQSTNHYGETYSWGGYSTCPVCPPYKRPNVWVCKETPPDGMGVPEPWKAVTIEVKKV